MGNVTKGRIIAVNGPLATCEIGQGLEVLQNEVAYVHCQGTPLKAEVIRIRGRQVDLQVFESTTGMVTGDEVMFSGGLLSATLGPGILGMIYDGLQNPLAAVAFSVAVAQFDGLVFARGRAGGHGPRSGNPAVQLRENAYRRVAPRIQYLHCPH